MKHPFQSRLLMGAGLITGAALLALAGCGERSRAEDNAPQRPPTAVEVVPVHSQTLREQVRGIGTLRAAETVEIRPEISGILRAVYFEEGAAVERGQLLFQIDDERLQRQLAVRLAQREASLARLNSARRTHDRLEPLRRQGAASVDEFDRAVSTLEEAVADLQRVEAEIALVESEIRQTRILAPTAAVVSHRQVDPGTYVQSGSLLATLYRIDPMEIEFTLPERYMGQVHRGQPVEMVVSAYRDRRFDGAVTYVSPSVNPTTRDFLVKASLENPQGLLKPGAFATALVTVDVRADRPVVPEEALVATRHGYIVFVVHGDEAVQRRVEVGMRQGGLVEITDGLAAGEPVVRTGHMRLNHGDPIRVVNAAPQQGGMAGAD